MHLKIKTKAVMMMILFGIIIGSVSLLICGRVLAKTVDRQYRDDATSIAATVAKVIDAEKFERLKNKVSSIYDAAENKVSSDDWGSDEFYEYIALFSDVENEQDFKDLRDYLREIQSVNNVDCLYIVYLDAPTKAFIYLVDAAEEDACPPGCNDPLYEQNYQLLDDPTVGFPAYITNTEAYGKLVTAGSPVYNADGAVIGYAMVDISMNDVRMEQIESILRLLLFLALAAVVIIVSAVVLIDFTVIKPIKKLSDSASGYYTGDETIEHNEFSKLNINTGDEIETLADSMKKMENDLNKHIKNLLSATNQLSISKSVANRMTELATTDTLTGIRNKTAYDYDIKSLDRQIQEGETRFGIAMIDLNFLKHTNDTYGHENGNAALMSLSRIICGVFVHSPVFRVGGDEFTVILMNNDYDKIGSLEAEFNEKIASVYADESLDPWMRISAALGYALYDPEKDHGTTDVFNRADKEMYTHKRQMKESGAKPL